MNTKLHRNEQGITALETAIILIAFVVVAAVFAFTILSTGTFLTERSKEAAYAGLQEVRGSMELKGSVVLETTGQYIVLNVSTVAGGSSVDLSKVKMSYRDSSTNKDVSIASADCSAPAYPATEYNWAVMQSDGTALTACILKSGNLAKLVVNLGTNEVDANKTFALELKPPTGGTMQIERTAPAQIDLVTDLH
ncbi:MAG: hypothetical protein HY870_09130 [Chloroflexi bacterium]|nr:hypothetical protein [Chloroflexota bacterium]